MNDQTNGAEEEFVMIPRNRTQWSDLLLRLASFAFLWLILNEGAMDSWVLGVPVTLIATYASLHISPLRSWHIHPLHVTRFVLFFLQNTIFSSIDVARRVFHPDLPIKPALLRYKFRIKEETPRVIIANTTSLLPGTLSVDVTENELLVHTLDDTLPNRDSLRRLEELVAKAYGVELED